MSSLKSEEASPLKDRSELFFSRFSALYESESWQGETGSSFVGQVDLLLGTSYAISNVLKVGASYSQRSSGLYQYSRRRATKKVRSPSQLSTYSVSVSAVQQHLHATLEK